MQSERVYGTAEPGTTKVWRRSIWWPSVAPAGMSLTAMATCAITAEDRSTPLTDLTSTLTTESSVTTLPKANRTKIEPLPEPERWDV